MLSGNSVKPFPVRFSDLTAAGFFKASANDVNSAAETEVINVIIQVKKVMNFSFIQDQIRRQI